MRKLVWVVLLLPIFFSCVKEAFIRSPEKVETDASESNKKNMAALVINGEVINDVTTGYWDGRNIPRAVSTQLSYTNNSITSINTGGYMLQAGDEVVGSTNGNLNGAIITGNKFIWNGVRVDESATTHGLFTGYNINCILKYNYQRSIPSGFQMKSAGMTNTSGGVGYNVFSDIGLVAIPVKGMKNVNIYNNTFYSNQPFSSNGVGGVWRGLIDIYANTDEGQDPTVSNSSGCKIKNNIFYTTHQIYNISIYDAQSVVGFESDYNVFYCTAGEPRFNYLGTAMTFTQWKLLGYDAHSIVVNPNFTDFTYLVPTARLNYGTNLGSTWQAGLATNAAWTAGASPVTANQDAVWQAGAYVFGTSAPTYYVSPSGSDSNNGSIGTPWKTLHYAFNQINPGDILYMRGGTYLPTVSQSVVGNYCAVGVNGKSGMAGLWYQVYNYPGEYPILDCNNITGSGARVGVYVNSSNYWYIKGLEVKNVSQTSDGAYVSRGFYFQNCTYSTAELINSHNNQALGMGAGTSNEILFLNCDSHDNYDPYTNTFPGDNADGYDLGFQSGGTIRLTGCRTWNNSDDGFDCYQGDGYHGTYIFTNCWAWHNGYRSDQVTTGGDGNGFKLGRDVQSYNGVTQRTLYNCISYDNRQVGISQQSADVKMIMYNNFAYRNGIQGFEFNYYNCADILRNNISYQNGQADVFQSNQTRDHNSWNVHVPTDADFVSVTSQLANARRTDGNLPIMTFLHLATGSPLIHAGANVGLASDGDGNSFASTPSIGPFEYNGTPAPGLPTLTTTAITSITSTTAISGGNISSDGGGAVTARGICWGIWPEPELAYDVVTTNGTGIGSFISNIIGALPSTLYHVRAYATNNAGTAYGNELTFTTSAAGSALTQSLSDSVTLADAHSTILGRNKSLADTVTLTDGAAIVTAFHLVLNLFENTLTLTDSTVKQSVYSRNIADSVALSDINAKNTSTGMADSITMGDNFSFVLNIMGGKSLADNITLSDSLGIKEISKVITDNITLVDANYPVDSSIISQVINDLLTLSDSITEKQIQKVFTDNVTLVDVIDRGKNTSAADSVTLLDNISKELQKTLSDGVTLSDNQIKLIIILIQDNFGLTDNTTLPNIFQYTLTDNVTLLDNQIKLSSVALTDIYSLIDSIILSNEDQHIFSDNVGLSDAIESASITHTIPVPPKHRCALLDILRKGLAFLHFTNDPLINNIPLGGSVPEFIVQVADLNEDSSIVSTENIPPENLNLDLGESPGEK